MCNRQYIKEHSTAKLLEIVNVILKIYFLRLDKDRDARDKEWKEEEESEKKVPALPS